MAELSEDQKKIADLEEKLAKSEEARVKAVKDASDAQVVVTDLKNQLSEKAVGTVELPTVTHGKDTYELVGGPFLYVSPDGPKEVTHELLKSDAKLTAELVKAGVSHLRKLSK